MTYPILNSLTLTSYHSKMPAVIKRIACTTLFTALCTGAAVNNAFAIDPIAAPHANYSAQNSAEPIATERLNVQQKHHSTNLDFMTERALHTMMNGDWIETTIVAQRLVDTFPDYALGHLLLAEALSVTAASDTMLTSTSAYSKQLIDLLLEARGRAQSLRVLTDKAAANKISLPSELIQVGKHIDHVVLVDLYASQFYLYDTTNSLPRLIKKHYISSGMAGYDKQIEGDLKTPLGVYRIHGFRSDDSLPPLYGSGALMLNYPNALDRSLGRSGSGIWLHGNPRNNRSRSPRSSEGCVTMANDHLLDLYQQINIERTAVILTHDIKWHDAQQIEQQQKQLQALFVNYRDAWLDNNIDALTAIYTPGALPSTIRYAGNATARRVSASDTASSGILSPPGISLDSLAGVQSSDLSIISNPSNIQTSLKQHLVMEFELMNASKSRVTLYWEKSSAGDWQIKREQINSAEI